MSILAELIGIAENLDGQRPFGYLPGMYGETIYIAPTKEQEAALQRATMLTELMKLRYPIGVHDGETELDANFGTPWGMVMATSKCPCPGVPESWWNEDYEMTREEIDAGYDAAYDQFLDGPAHREIR